MQKAVGDWLKKQKPILLNRLGSKKYKKKFDKNFVDY